MSNLMKPVTQPEEVDNVAVPSSTQKREERIRVAVLTALGRPAELIKVSVLPLWGDNFRVNVWTTGGAGAAIPNSYFVTAGVQAAADAGLAEIFRSVLASISTSGAQVALSETITGPAETNLEVGQLAPGSYPFLCTIHTNMTGTLTVQ